jgi:hypothetical protein
LSQILGLSETQQHGRSRYLIASVSLEFYHSSGWHGKTAQGKKRAAPSGTTVAPRSVVVVQQRFVRIMNVSLMSTGTLRVAILLGSQYFLSFFNKVQTLKY